MLPVRYPSRDEAQRYRHELRHTVEALRGRAQTDGDALAWPGGLDRGILLGLPLRDGTHRRLLQAGLMEGDSPLTVHEVVRIPNVSLRAMREAVVAADAFLSECIDTFDDAPTPAAIVAMRLRQQVKRLTPRERTIIEHRLLRRPPTTLAALGGMFAISSSRIRHLQARATERIRIAFGNEIPFIATALVDALGHSADMGTVNRRIDEVFPNGNGETSAFAKKLFRQAVLNEMSLTLDQGVYVSGANTASEHRAPKS